MTDQPTPTVPISEPAAAAGPFLHAPGRTRSWMNWFFADKQRMYWILQSAGWTSFFLFHILSVSTFVAGRSPAALLYSLASSLIGFFVTVVITRPVYRFARRQRPAMLIPTVLISTIFMAVAMSAMKAQTFGILFGYEWIDLREAMVGTSNFLFLIIPDVPVNLFLLGSWGGFYFGINYYLNLRNESERAVLSAHLADQAQLKMLRYQLNPHFLFNTLNAISTLVLEQDGKHANNMLTKLSAFLRYSLDSDPLQKVSLAEEVRALKLYLDIEETRFVDRLHVRFNIDEDVQNALVPSLLLQPAIENAIKYAIARMESGGEILIAARRTGNRLHLSVCDNGPDAPDNPSTLISDLDRGVGLVNMRDRLFHLYGDDCDFVLKKNDPCGFSVNLYIPIENNI